LDFRCWKAFSCASVHTNLASFFRSLYSGDAIRLQFGMNHATKCFQLFHDSGCGKLLYCRYLLGVRPYPGLSYLVTQIVDFLIFIFAPCILNVKILLLKPNDAHFCNYINSKNRLKLHYTLRHVSVRAGTILREFPSA
jgi:hypothetical protein